MDNSTISIDVKKKLVDFELSISINSNAKRIGILGASGCGKSMTLKSIAGIETPNEGFIRFGDNVLFDSKDKINLKPQMRNIGYLFQNYALFPTMTVEENIAAGLKCGKEEKKEIVKEMIAKFHLSGLEKRLPGQLSGGQQQRVALARIMAYEPTAILLDEPFSALDSFLKDRLQQELLDMLKDYEGCVIMVSHSRDEIYRFSEELIIMDNGQVVEQGQTKELFHKPTKIASARLTGCKNYSEVKIIDAHHMKLVDWDVDCEISAEIPPDTKHIGYRAHDFIPVWGERDKNCIELKLSSIAELPFETNYYIKAVKEDKANICWFAQGDVSQKLRDLGRPDYLKLNEDGIIYLKD